MAIDEQVRTAGFAGRMEGVTFNLWATVLQRKHVLQQHAGAAALFRCRQQSGLVSHLAHPAMHLCTIQMTVRQTEVRSAKVVRRRHRTEPRTLLDTGTPYLST